VLTEGAVMAVIGIGAGALAGYGLTQLATAYFAAVQVPGALPAIAAAVVLLLAAVIASVLPAARAARTDVVQALRSE
jgi:ABC-type antimicrobial peptide transport system permease subunit